MSDEGHLELRRLAYRRAAYAVALHTQGRRVPHLTLEPPAAPASFPEGRPRAWQADLGGRARHHTELEILARWTGLLGESRACLGDREPPGGWGAALEPLAALGERVTRSPEENDAYLEWLRRRAHGLLDLPAIWAAVEALTDTLLAEGKVGSREASEIIAGVQRARRRRTGLAGVFRNPR